MDLTTLQHNPHLEELTDMLCAKTQNTDKGFFRIEVAYFLAKIASCMRVHIKTNTIAIFTHFFCAFLLCIPFPMWVN